MIPGTGPAPRNNEFLTSELPETTPETTSETTPGPSPEPLGPSLLGPRTVVSEVVSGVVSGTSEVRNSPLYGASRRLDPESELDDSTGAHTFPHFVILFLYLSRTLSNSLEPSRDLLEAPETL